MSVPSEHRQFSRLLWSMGLLAQFLLVGVVYLSLQFARLAYERTVPGMPLPRLTATALYAPWVFAVIGAVCAIYAFKNWRTKAAGFLAAFLLVDIVLIGVVLWSVLLPFGLMAK